MAILVLACMGCQKPVQQTREVRVAAASDLRFALEEMLAEFSKQHRDISVKPTYGSSGNFYAQLSNKAPFDVFLSADVEYPRKLIEQGLAANESEFTYARGEMVVWVPNDSKLDIESGMRAMLDPAVRKIAIANPKHAPYGRAAEAAMKSLGVYDQVLDRLVLGENVAQTAQFIESGAADIGIIALSLAAAPAMKEKGSFWKIPLDAFPRLDQGGIILNSATDPEAAALLRAFIISSEGQAILHRYGFDLPGE